MNKMILAIGLALSCQIAVGMDQLAITLGAQCGDDKYCLQIWTERRNDNNLLTGKLKKAEDGSVIVVHASERIGADFPFKIIALEEEEEQLKSIPQQAIVQEFINRCNKLTGNAVLSLSLKPKPLVKEMSRVLVSDEPRQSQLKILIDKEYLGNFIDAEGKQAIEASTRKKSFGENNSGAQNENLKLPLTSFSWRSLILSPYGFAGVATLTGFFTWIYFKYLQK